MHVRSLLFSLFCLAGLFAVHADARAAASQKIDATNLYHHESHWPTHVRLTGPIPRGEGQADVPAGRVGVLVRVEPDGQVRLDLGRDGRHVVPIERTDVLEGANAAARGASYKLGPNLTLAIASKLVDPSKPGPATFPYRAQKDLRGALCVFADPNDEDFEALARSLAPLHRREGVTMVLFPETDQADRVTADRLRALDWTIPFVFNAHAESLRRSFVAESSELPWVQLMTNEGRLIAEGPFDPALRARLEQAIDANFASATPEPPQG